MKNFLLVCSSLILVFLLSSLAPGRDITVNTFKSKGEVTLVITGSNMDNIKEVIIQRGTDAGEALRQIKILTPKEMEMLKNAPLTWIDKFPLSGASNAYYRAVVTYKEGFQRIYPAVETKIDSTFTK